MEKGRAFPYSRRKTAACDLNAGLRVPHPVPFPLIAQRKGEKRKPPKAGPHPHMEGSGEASLLSIRPGLRRRNAARSLLLLKA